MILVTIVHIVVEILIERLCFHFSVIVGNGDNLMLGKLNGTSLVYIDMTTTYADNSLVLIQHRVDGGSIGLGATCKEEYLGIG